MGTAILHLDAWSLAWHGFWTKIAPPCGHSDCLHTKSMWGRLRGRPGGVVIQGVRYCRDQCLERALGDAMDRIRQDSPRRAAAHRVPLGLLLLSRQQLTVEQLRAALAAQRLAGRGKIGEWLRHLGFASESQITAALARQWSCPVLRSDSWKPVTGRVPQIPVALLESSVMIPVDYVETSGTLHLAFGEGIDYRVLYAIEQMMGCHTESCMAVPSFVRKHLRALSGHRGESEMVFEHVSDSTELSRIIRSYCTRVAASEIRLAACGPFLWVRLLRSSRRPVDLVLGSSQRASSPGSLPPAAEFPSA